MMMIWISAIALFLSMFLMILSSTISKKSTMDREKSSPFECGFDPKSYSRMPFSLQFFLIAVIFLIFDVEITLLLPLIVTIKLSNMLNFTTISLFFMIILLAGLYHEWNQGALKWTK